MPHVDLCCSVKNLENQTRQGSLLKSVEVDGFSSPIQSWIRLFIMLKICPFEISQVSHNIWAISLQRKTLSFFSRFKASINTHLSINFTTLEICSHSLYFERNCYFSFLSVMSDKQGSTISESLKFTGSIYSGKKLFLAFLMSCGETYDFVILLTQNTT